MGLEYQSNKEETMSKKFEVTCSDKFWDSRSGRLYYPGNREMVDPLSPMANKFEGWPPGTVVYAKVKGVNGTRVVPGGEEPKVDAPVDVPLSNQPDAPAVAPKKQKLNAGALRAVANKRKAEISK
jgi:hypothetical protein